MREGTGLITLCVAAAAAASLDATRERRCEFSPCSATLRARCVWIRCSVRARERGDVFFFFLKGQGWDLI